MHSFLIFLISETRDMTITMKTRVCYLFHVSIFVETNARQRHSKKSASRDSGNVTSLHRVFTIPLRVNDFQVKNTLTPVTPDARSITYSPGRGETTTVNIHFRVSVPPRGLAQPGAPPRTRGKV